MKNKWMISIGYLLLGLLWSIGPNVLFPPCEKGMACRDTADAVLAVSLIVLLGAVLYFFSETARERIILSVVGLGSALSVFLITNVWIKGCKMQTMRCVTGTIPGINIGVLIMAVLSIVNLTWLVFEQARQKKENVK